MTLCKTQHHSSNPVLFVRKAKKSLPGFQETRHTHPHPHPFLKHIHFFFVRFDSIRLKDICQFWLVGTSYLFENGAIVVMFHLKICSASLNLFISYLTMIRCSFSIRIDIHVPNNGTSCASFLTAIIVQKGFFLLLFRTQLFIFHILLHSLHVSYVCLISV